MSTKALKSSTDLDLYKSIRRDKNELSENDSKYGLYISCPDCDPHCSPNLEHYRKRCKATLDPAM